MGQLGEFRPNRAAATRLRLGARSGGARAARHVLARSLERAPVEDDDLAESATTSQTDTATGVRSAVSYGARAGGSEVPFYAARQHEDLDLQHDAGRTAKYLEGPLVEERAEVARLVAEGVRARLR